MMLSINEISYKIGDYEILHNVTASLNKESVVALIGPNGAGKTTLINILSGYIRPTSGQILYGGEELSKLEPDRIARLGITRTFQGEHLAWNLTTLENVLCALDDHKDMTWTNSIFNRKRCYSKDRYAREEAYSALQRFHLQDCADMPVRELSFGQRRLIVFARAFARPAALMILD